MSDPDPPDLMVGTARAEETEALGERIGTALEGPLVITLQGPLGSGKTVFVRGLGRGLGIPPDEISSPTFVLCHEHEGRLPLFHFDAYRIVRVEEFSGIGFAEYLNSGGVVVVEWAERIRPLVSVFRLDVVIRVVSDFGREIHLRGHGEEASRVLRALREVG